MFLITCRGKRYIVSLRCIRIPLFEIFQGNNFFQSARRGEKINKFSRFLKHLQIFQRIFFFSAVFFIFFPYLWSGRGWLPVQKAFVVASWWQQTCLSVFVESQGAVHVASVWFGHMLKL